MVHLPTELKLLILLTKKKDERGPAGDAEYLSYTPGSHSTCTIRTRTVWGQPENFSIRKEPILSVQKKKLF